MFWMWHICTIIGTTLRKPLSPQTVAVTLPTWTNFRGWTSQVRSPPRRMMRKLAQKVPITLSSAGCRPPFGECNWQQTETLWKVGQGYIQKNRLKIPNAVRNADLVVFFTATLKVSTGGPKKRLRLQRYVPETQKGSEFPHKLQIHFK